MRYNVKNYILKPIDEDELSQILRRIYKEITSEMRLEKEHALGIDAMVSRTIKKIIKGEGARNYTSKPWNYFKFIEMNLFTISRSNRIIIKYSL